MNSKTERQTEATAKKSYRRPELVAYGTVAELTKGAGGTVTDGGGTFHP